MYLVHVHHGKKRRDWGGSRPGHGEWSELVTSARRSVWKVASRRR